MAIRDFPQALSEIERAEALDSASTAILADKALILSHGGKDEEAIGLLRRLEQAQPDFYSPHAYLASIYLGRGDDRDFLQETAAAARARNNDDAQAVARAGVAGFTAAGHDGMCRAMLGVEKQLYARGKISAYELALAYATVNDDTNAIAFLKLSLLRRETDNVALAVEQRLEKLRAKPEFQPLLAMAGLASHA
jgi:tetratricopeptide (TPR) repeat protein